MHQMPSLIVRPPNITCFPQQNERHVDRIVYSNYNMTVNTTSHNQRVKKMGKKDK